MPRAFTFSLNRIALACCAGLAFAVAQPALAQTAPAAPVEAVRTAPELTLQAAASSEVKQDTVRISLSVEVEANDQASVGKRLTAALDDVVKRARGTKNVEIRTGGYNVWPNTNTKGKITNWRGQGEIVLESTDFEAASALAAKLGDKTAISNIGFFLSREGREAEERKLLGQAAQAFKARALAAANAFGFSGYRLSKLDLSGGGSPAPMPRMMMDVAAMAKGGEAAGAPGVPLEAGEVTVSVTVGGTIFLQ